LLQQLDLDRFRDVKCGVLSSGEQRSVGLAKVLLNDPQLLTPRSIRLNRFVALAFSWRHVWDLTPHTHLADVDLSRVVASGYNFWSWPRIV